MCAALASQQSTSACSPPASPLQQHHLQNANSLQEARNDCSPSTQQTDTSKAIAASRQRFFRQEDTSLQTCATNKYQQRSSIQQRFEKESSVESVASRKQSIEHPTRKLSRQDARAVICISADLARRHTQSSLNSSIDLRSPGANSLNSISEFNNNDSNVSPLQTIKMPITDPSPKQTHQQHQQHQQQSTLINSVDKDNNNTITDTHNAKHAATDANVPSKRHSLDNDSHAQRSANHDRKQNDAAARKAAEAASERNNSTTSHSPIPSYASIFQPFFGPNLRQKPSQKIAAEAKIVANAVKRSSSTTKQPFDDVSINDIDSHNNSASEDEAPNQKRTPKPAAVVPGSVVYATRGCVCGGAVPLATTIDGQQTVGFVSGAGQYALGAANTAFYPTAEHPAFDKISAQGYTNQSYQRSSHHHSSKHRHHRNLSGNITAFATNSKLNTSNSSNKHFINDTDSSEDDSYHKQRFANEICMAAANDPMFRNYSRYSKCHLMLKSIILGLVLLMLLSMVIGVILAAHFAPSFFESLMSSTRTFQVTVSG